MLANAATFKDYGHEGEAVALLERAARLRPDVADYHLRLAFKLESTRHLPGVADSSARVFGEYAKGLALASSPPGPVILARAATAALRVDARDEARAWATALLASADEERYRWYRPQAIHAAHTVLGVLAARDGEVAEAAEHLIASATIVPDYHFVPRMVLASALLELGERAVVLRYLELCRALMDAAYVEKWRREVEAGRKPADWEDVD